MIQTILFLIQIWSIFLGVIALSALLVAAFYLLQIRRTNGSIQSLGKKRTYRLYVPPTYRPDTPAPLIISIHGYAEWPAHQMDISRWNRLADENGLIIVYPCGTGMPPHWNTNGRTGSPQDPAREVRFFSDLIGKLESEYSIDSSRIYANGLSNGGGMSFLLGCKLSERIAAIASVSGGYLNSWSDYTPARAVPMILFHGTADPIVPFSGGRSTLFDFPFPNIPDWIQALAARSGCNSEPLKQALSDSISRSQYQNCAQNSELVFYEIKGGGHAWPGGPALPGWLVGETNQEIDATDLIWEFFRRHPLGS